MRLLARTRTPGRLIPICGLMAVWAAAVTDALVPPRASAAQLGGCYGSSCFGRDPQDGLQQQLELHGRLTHLPGRVGELAGRPALLADVRRRLAADRRLQWRRCRILGLRLDRRAVGI